MCKAPPGPEETPYLIRVLRVLRVIRVKSVMVISTYWRQLLLDDVDKKVIDDDRVVPARILEKMISAVAVSFGVLKLLLSSVMVA